mmetsp:Transcript_12854/g.45007  ORF Transcript_12854/g.45007 Transcript_12854/m.45007 type:complete len:355 (+) Transcript_12854:701-1765(+)
MSSPARRRRCAADGAGRGGGATALTGSAAGAEAGLAAAAEGAPDGTGEVLGDAPSSSSPSVSGASSMLPSSARPGTADSRALVRAAARAALASSAAAVAAASSSAALAALACTAAMRSSSALTCLRFRRKPTSGSRYGGGGTRLPVRGSTWRGGTCDRGGGGGGSLPFGLSSLLPSQRNVTRGLSGHVRNNSSSSALEMVSAFPASSSESSESSFRGEPTAGLAAPAPAVREGAAAAAPDAPALATPALLPSAATAFFTLGPSFAAPPPSPSSSSVALLSRLRWMADRRNFFSGTAAARCLGSSLRIATLCTAIVRLATSSIFCTLAFSLRPILDGATVRRETKGDGRLERRNV